MKKALSVTLAVVMVFTLATVLSAAPLANVPLGGFDGSFADEPFFYGEDPVVFMLEDTTDDDFANNISGPSGGGDSGLGAPLATDGYNGATTFRNTGDYSLSVSVNSNNSDAKISYRLIKNADRDAVGIEITITPAAEKFTVEDIEADNAEFTIKVVQKVVGEPAVTAQLKLANILENTRAYHTDAYADASGNYFVDAPSLDTDLADGKNDNARVIDVSVFEKADGKALTIDYDKYAVKFAKVSKQNTSLYLYAKTGVVSVTDTKAIGSIAFQPTRVKDAATITMPISFDNQNFYGETVYVYNVVDGKPTGEAIAAEVVNHNSIVFTVPAGTALGTFAAYGAKTEGDAEKPAIPETGANDIVNIAIVFAVVALAAAGFVAVKKASK